MSTSNATKHQGGCHCGAVRYEVEVDLSKDVTRCNCSICQKLGKTGVTLKPAAFRLLRGEDALSSYAFGGKVGEYLFCKHCGIHSFGRGYLEYLGGAFVSVNVACLDDVELVDLDVKHFDGRHDNWQAGPRDTPWRVHG